MSSGLIPSLVDTAFLGSSLFAKLAFLGFFALALVAIVFHRRPVVRRVYVVCFFAGLLVVSVSVVQAYPLNDLHKFSFTGEDEEEVYKMYVVDGDGNELRFDRRVVPTYAPPPPPYSTMAEMLATRCTEREANLVGRYLLVRAESYRERVTTGGNPIEWIDFPRHHIEDRWTASELEDFGPFTAIAVDRVDITFEPDSYAIRSRNVTRVRTVRASQNRTTPDRNSVPEWVNCAEGS